MPLYYFAYGSNMLTSRLHPELAHVDVAYLDPHYLG